MNCRASFGSTRDGSRGGKCRNAEEALMAIVAGFDVHRRQITFDALDTETGEVSRGRIDATPAAVTAWARRFGRRDVRVAVEACTWLFV
jgi:transposase